MKDEQQKAARPQETTNWSRPEGQTELHAGATLPADEAIAREVDALLQDDASIDLANANISVSDGEVTLEGYAARLSDKEHAEEMILDLEGVNVVHNNLRIAPERH